MGDLLDAVLEDIASDVGVTLSLPAPAASLCFDYESPARPNKSRRRPHPTPLTPSSSLSSTGTKRRLTSLSPFTSPTPVTPHSRRHCPLSAASAGDFVSVSPEQLTPVKAEVDALLSAIVRRSPRQHPEPNIALSEQLAIARRSRERQSSAASSALHPLLPASPSSVPRASATPSKPPFHRSPHQRGAQRKAPPAYLTPQLPSQARREASARRAGQRRHLSDGVATSSRRFHQALLKAGERQSSGDESTGSGLVVILPALSVEEETDSSALSTTSPAPSSASLSPSASPVAVDSGHLHVPAMGALEKAKEFIRDETPPVGPVTRGSARSSSKVLF